MKISGVGVGVGVLTAKAQGGIDLSGSCVLAVNVSTASVKPCHELTYINFRMT